MCNKTPTSTQPADRVTVSVSRSEALRLYLRGRGITWTSIGALLGVSPQRVHAMLGAAAMPEKHRTALLETYSIPEHLLPAPSRGRRGPEPGWLDDLRRSASASA